MITIVSTITVYGLDETLSRCCCIIITGIGANYHQYVGGLPLEGDLQPILDARHEELLVAAIERGEQKTAQEVRYLLYAASWSNEAFQAAVIENMAENVGGSMPGFADILDLFEQINEEWPVDNDGNKD